MEIRPLRASAVRPAPHFAGRAFATPRAARVGPRYADPADSCSNAGLYKPGPGKSRSAGGSASSSFFPAKAPSGTATVTTTIVPTTPPPTPSASPSPSPSPSVYYTTPAPVGAPSTGGGGTAGLQHVGLFALGALAVLGGLVSLIYRRRALRR